MTVDDVRSLLAEIEIESVRNDDETAHASEDAMRDLVLEAIANGAPNAAELASEALRSNTIEFSRWCA
jgi:hypothetical protein